MTEVIDAEIVKEFNRVLKFPINRMIWGQLETAKQYWTRYMSSHKGVGCLPYLAIYRIHKFHDLTKKTELVDIIDTDDIAKRVKSLQVMLAYTIEILTVNVSDQNKLVKRFMLWAASESALSVTDANGTKWSWRIIAEDPEDNSDLESEDEQGRVIRTTFTFQVESILLDRTEDNTGVILDILAQIHGYYGDNMAEIHIVPEV